MTKRIVGFRNFMNAPKITVQIAGKKTHLHTAMKHPVFRYFPNTFISVFELCSTDGPKKYGEQYNGSRTKMSLGNQPNKLTKTYISQEDCDDVQQ
jgi:hypothetical protein